MDVDWIARGIALTSLLVSIVALVVRIASLRRTSARQKPRIVVEMLRWMFVYGKHGKADFLLIEIRASNGSDLANSIVEYGLVIGPPYRDSIGPVHYSKTQAGETVLDPTPGSRFRPDPLALKGISLDFLSNPANLPPHESRIGWVAFPLPSIPVEIAKGVPFLLWTVLGEGDPVVTQVDLSTGDSVVIDGTEPTSNE